MPCAEAMALNEALDGKTKLSASHFKTPVSLDTDATIILEGCLAEQKGSNFAKRWVVMEKCPNTSCIYLKIYRFSEAGGNPVTANFKYQYILTEGEFIGSIKGMVRSSRTTSYSWAIIMNSDILQFQDKSKIICDAWYGAIRENIRYITWEVKTVSGFSSGRQESILFLTNHLLAMCPRNVSKVMTLHKIRYVYDVEAVDSHVKFTTNENGERCSFEIETIRAPQATRIVAEILARKAALPADTQDGISGALENRNQPRPPMIQIRKESFLPMDSFPTPPSTPNRLSPYSLSPAGSPSVSPRLIRSGECETIREDVQDERMTGGRQLKKPGEHVWVRKTAIRRRPSTRVVQESDVPQAKEKLMSLPRMTIDQAPPIPARPFNTLGPGSRKLSLDQPRSKHHDEASRLTQSLSAMMLANRHSPLMPQISVGCARCIDVCVCESHFPVLPPKIVVPSEERDTQFAMSTSSGSSLGDTSDFSKSHSTHSLEVDSYLSASAQDVTALEDEFLRGNHLSLPEDFIADKGSCAPFSPILSPTTDNHFFPASPLDEQNSSALPQFSTRDKPQVSPRSPPPVIPPRQGQGSQNYRNVVDVRNAPRRHKPPIPNRSDSLLKSEDEKAVSTRTFSSPRHIPKADKLSLSTPHSMSLLSSLGRRNCVVCKGICKCANRISSSVQEYVKSVETTDGYISMTAISDPYIVPGGDRRSTGSRLTSETEDSIYLTPAANMSQSSGVTDSSVSPGTRRKTKPKPKPLPKPKPRKGDGPKYTKWRKRESVHDDTYCIPKKTPPQSLRTGKGSKSCGDVHQLFENETREELSSEHSKTALQSTKNERPTKKASPIRRAMTDPSPEKTLFQVLIEYISRSAPPLDNLGIAPGAWAHFLIALDCENSGHILNDWRGIGKFMGVPEKEMKLVEQQCRKSDRWASEFILLYWSTHQHPVLPYTLENLYDVLNTLKRRDLVEIIKGT